MVKKTFDFMERFFKLRYFIALLLLICIIWVIIEVCFIHFVIWDKVFYYPEEEYEFLEQEILSSDNIFDEEFKNKFDVDILGTKYYSDTSSKNNISSQTEVKVSSKSASISVYVKDYELPNQKIVGLERSIISKQWKIFIDIVTLLLIYGGPSGICVVILTTLYWIIYEILHHIVKKQGKHFIKE